MNNSEDFFYNVEKPKREKIINLICDIWYNDLIITKTLIISGLKKSGIFLNIDSSEDNYFQFSSDNEEILLKKK